MVRVLVSLGIEKIRLTGGEPLLRAGLAEMVAELADMRTAFKADGTAITDSEAGRPLDIALTTNGHLLESLAEPLARAGLNRVTVSTWTRSIRKSSRASHACHAVMSACWPGCARHRPRGWDEVKNQLRVHAARLQREPD